MSTNLNQLDQWIQQIEKIPQVVENSTSEIEASIDILITNQLDAGKTPNGATWKLNKDGSQPLVGIKKYVDLSVSGSTVSVSLSEPATFHQTGTDKLPKRQIIPEGEIPIEWSNAIGTALVNSWDKIFGK